MSEWNLVGVLPNLPIDRSWEFEHIAFVHPSDPRLNKLRSTNPADRALLTNFTTEFGSACPPAALIVSGDSPKRLQTAEAMADIRNAFAMAAILYGWQHAIGNLNVWWPLYSDYFDLYPVFPSKDGKGLVRSGFGLSAYDEARKFRGQPYPDLPVGNSTIKVTVDERLRSALVREWKAKHSRGKARWEQVSLFRSLAMAYRAARLPKGCDLTIFDIGIQISLWISAHECLVHPGQGGKTGLKEVLTMLGKKIWLAKKLAVKRRQTWKAGNGQGTKTEPLTYVQHLYRRLYNARNDFLHGNPVSREKLFMGPLTRNSLSIQVAPLVYSAALEVVLAHCDTRQIKRGLGSVRDVFLFDVLDRALLKTRERRNRD